MECRKLTKAEFLAKVQLDTERNNRLEQKMRDSVECSRRNRIAARRRAVRRKQWECSF